MQVPLKQFPPFMQVTSSHGCDGTSGLQEQAKTQQIMAVMWITDFMAGDWLEGKAYFGPQVQFQILITMMKRMGLVLGTVLVLGATSCTSNQFLISPPFTTTAEIANLTSGMTRSEAESALGIPAYEVLSMVGGDLWVSYNYRVASYLTPITNYANGLNVSGPDAQPVSVDAPAAKNQGTLQYGDWGVLYVLFSEGKLATTITEAGQGNSNNLEVLQASLKNHSTDSPVYVVGKHGYVKDENGILKLLPERECRYKYGRKGNTKNTNEQP